MLRVHQRWHTRPPPPQVVPPLAEPLNAVLPANGHAPLYWLLREAVTGNAPVPTWIKGLYHSFDSIVVPGLKRAGYVFPAADWEILQAFTQFYGAGEPKPPTLHVAVGRLLTLTDLIAYMGKEAFSPPPPKMGILTDCHANANYRDHPMLMSHLHPKDPHRVYEITYQTAWPLDPLHHWGVYVERSKDMHSDEPIRIRMSCCGEHVGITEGCWLSLVAGQPVGEPVPYTLLPTLRVWDYYAANNDTFPPLADWVADRTIGTAFRDVYKYEELHNKITSLWSVFVPHVLTALAAYAVRLQAAVDNTAPAPADPFEVEFASEEHKAVLRELLGFVDAYNIFHTCHSHTQMREFALEKMFQVPAALALFTDENRGGLFVPAAGAGRRARMPFLRPEEPLREDDVQTLMNTINALANEQKVGRYAVLTPLMRKARDLRTLIVEANDLHPTFQRMRDLLTRAKALQVEAPLSQLLLKWEGDVGNHDADLNSFAEQKRDINNILRRLRHEDVRLPEGAGVAVLRGEKVATADRLKETEEDLRILEAERLEPEEPRWQVYMNHQWKIKETRDLFAKAQVLYNEALDPLPAPPSNELGLGAEYEELKDARALELTTFLRAKKEIGFSVKWLYVIDSMALSNQGIQRWMQKQKLTPDVFDDDSATIRQAQADYQEALNTYNQDVRDTEARFAAEQARDLNSARELARSLKEWQPNDESWLTWIATIGSMIDALAVLPTWQTLVKPLRSKFVDFDLQQSALEKAKRADDAKKEWKRAADLLLDAFQTQFLLATQGGLSAGIPQEILGRFQKDLADAEAALQRPLQWIEDPAARKARIAKERLGLVNKYFDTWLNMSHRQMILESAQAMQALRPLWDATIKGFSQKRLKPLVEHALITASLELPTQFYDDARIRDYFTEVAGALYVQNMSGDLLKHQWRVFRDFMLTFDLHSGVDAQLKAFAGRLMQVPEGLRSFDAIRKDQGPPIELAALDILPVTPTGSSLLTRHAIGWDANSCWIDTAMMALFAIPGTALTRHFYRAKQIRPYRRELVGNNVKLELGCSKQEIQTLHQALISDIDYIQNPVAMRASSICQLRSLWNSFCVNVPLASNVTEGDPINLFETLQKLYEAPLHLQGVPDPTLRVCEVTGLANPDKTLVMLADNINNYFREAPQPWTIVDANAEYQLTALVYGLIKAEKPVDPFHYIAHLLDPATNTWWKWDKSADRRTAALVKLDDVVVQNQFASHDMYYWQTSTPGESKFVSRVLTGFVFFPRAEIEKLVAKVKPKAAEKAEPAKPQPQPQPQPVIVLPGTPPTSPRKSEITQPALPGVYGVQVQGGKVTNTTEDTEAKITPTTQTQLGVTNKDIQILFEESWKESRSHRVTGLLHAAYGVETDNENAVVRGLGMAAIPKK